MYMLRVLDLCSTMKIHTNYKEVMYEVKWMNKWEKIVLWINVQKHKLQRSDVRGEVNE